MRLATSLFFFFFARLSSNDDEKEGNYVYKIRKKSIKNERRGQKDAGKKEVIKFVSLFFFLFPFLFSSETSEKKENTGAKSALDDLSDTISLLGTYRQHFSRVVTMTTTSFRNIRKSQFIYVSHSSAAECSNCSCYVNRPGVPSAKSARTRLSLKRRKKAAEPQISFISNFQLQFSRLLPSEHTHTISEMKPIYTEIV